MLKRKSSEQDVARRNKINKVEASTTPLSPKLLSPKPSSPSSPSDLLLQAPISSSLPSDNHVLSPKNHALTAENLARLDSEATPDASSYTSESSTSEHSSAMTDSSQQLLEAHRIYLDQNTTKPPEIQALVNLVTAERTGPPTPKSKMVTKFWPDTQRMSERDAQRVLDDLLGYKGEKEYQEGMEEMGMTNIKRSYDRPFNVETLPLASSAQEALKKNLASLDCPSTPKPDISYGYTTAALGRDTWWTVKLPFETRTLNDEPWFCYWHLEWKGKGGNMKDADLQARRDGAAAVNAMHRFYEKLGQSQDPASSAVFTLCVDKDFCRLRVHWRNDTDPDNICFEGEAIGACVLNDVNGVYQMRGYLFKILDWASKSRLEGIRAALKAGEEKLRLMASPKKMPRSPKKSTTSKQDSEVSQSQPRPPVQTVFPPPPTPPTSGASPRIRADPKKRRLVSSSDVELSRD